MNRKKENPIFRSDGKVIGTVEGQTFRKVVRSIHQLRTPPAWALSIFSIDQAERSGASRVEIFNLDTKTCYRASIELIRRDGFPIERGGYEPQIALPLDKWQISRPGAPWITQAALFEVGVK